MVDQKGRRDNKEECFERETWKEHEAKKEEKESEISLAEEREKNLKNNVKTLDKKKKAKEEEEEERKSERKKKGAY